MRKMKVIITHVLREAENWRCKIVALSLIRGNPNHQLYARGAFNVAPIKIAFA